MNVQGRLQAPRDMIVVLTIEASIGELEGLAKELQDLPQQTWGRKLLEQCVQVITKAKYSWYGEPEKPKPAPKTEAPAA